MSFSFAEADSENAQVTMRDSVPGIILWPAGSVGSNVCPIPNLGQSCDPKRRDRSSAKQIPAISLPCLMSTEEGRFTKTVRMDGR